MKKFLFISFIIALSGQLIAQNTFNKLEDYFGTNGKSTSYPHATILYGNNYFINIGIYDTLNIYHFCIIKTNLQGNEVDRFVFTNPEGIISQYANQTLISTNDSNLIACANLVDSSWDGYLIKFNRNLDTLWTRVYDLPANMAGCTAGTNTINYFTAIKETPDKGFIIAGNYYKYCVNNDANLRGFLLKVDSVGNIEWWKAFNDVADLFDIELSVNGGYLVFNKWGGKNIVEFDSLGNEIWRKPLNYVAGKANTGDIEYCGNGNYAAASTYLWDFPNDDAKAFAVMFNVYSQQIIWDTVYYLFHDIKSLSLNQVMGLEIDPQGNLIIWATAHVVDAPYGGGKRGAVLKLNSQGDSLWARYYEAPNSTWDDDLQLNDLIIADDGGYMGVGYELNANFEVKAWLFKTDASGVLGWNNEIPIPNPINYEIYPNPTYDYITLKYDSESDGEIFYSITDGSGKLVLQKQLEISEYPEKTEVMIDLRSLEPGVYYFNLFTNSRSKGIRKLIILE